MLAWRCTHCGGPYELVGLPPFDPAAIEVGEGSLWRYRAMVPVGAAGLRPISLGEGWTPLIPLPRDSAATLVKLESFAPTGSFKDRGTAVLTSHLRDLGVSRVIEDSSGNAGASLAAYAAAAGIHARIYAPSHTTPSKLRQIAVFGAELQLVDGPRQAATEACLVEARTTYYASHAWSPFFLLGQMTVAWEIWEQLGQRAPDGVLVPVGQGGMLLGLYRGFRALLQAGLITRLPRLYALQARACAPVVLAWEAGSTTAPAITAAEPGAQTTELFGHGRAGEGLALPKPLPLRPEQVACESTSIAEGISIREPVRGHEIMHALRESGGAAFAVDEPEIHSTVAELARRGLLAEPTSAVAFAGLAKVRATLGPEALLVGVLTGTGLKTQGAI